MVGVEIEPQLRASAARVDEFSRDWGAGAGARVSFEIVRGDAEAMLSLASERDLVIAGAAPGRLPLWNMQQARSCSHAMNQTQAAVVALIRAVPGRRGCSGRRRALPSSLALISPLLRHRGSLPRRVPEQIEPGRVVHLQIETASAETTGLHRRIAELGFQLLALDAAATEKGGLAEITKRFTCNIRPREQGWP
jgi:hypothetical protein